jgi:hypothetical protein
MTTNTPIWSKTCDKDLPLFQQLGFKPFQTDNNKKILVGIYKLPLHKKAKIKVFVTCLPQQYWVFEVAAFGGDFYLMHSGEGALSDFWDSAFKIAAGTLIVNKL